MYAVLVAPPATEPITLAEAKAHCRVTHSAEDDLIGAYVSAARQYAEEYTRRAFVTQTWRATLDAFPYRSGSRLLLPRPPLLAVTEVAYTDGSGVSQIVAAGSYTSIADPVAPYLLPLYAAEWPTARDYTGAVRVTYTAGYGAAAAVPEAIKSAIRLMVAHFSANREAVVTGTISTMPMAVEALLGPYRVRVAA
ncbi:MAG: head-tail connector protein [Actinomycetota bacterium]|nr:head-tail connector protein [Actinomycetota bacterium]